MVNPTYKHLETSLRLGALTLAQWAQVTVAVSCAAVFALYLSPFGPDVTIFVSIFIGGLPLAVSYGAMGPDFSVAEQFRAAWRYWREPGRYLSGSGGASTGYVVRRESSTEEGGVGSPPPTDSSLDLAEALWDV
jgi:hypothetical protein